MSPSPESESLSTDSGICEGVTYRHRIDDPCESACYTMLLATGVPLCANANMACYFHAAQYDWCVVPDTGEIAHATFADASSAAACSLLTPRVTPHHEHLQDMTPLCSLASLLS